MTAPSMSLEVSSLCFRSSEAAISIEFRRVTLKHILCCTIDILEENHIDKIPTFRGGNRAAYLTCALPARMYALMASFSAVVVYNLVAKQLMSER